MSGFEGLRERKKRRMYQRLSDTAVALFLERGFEKVSVAEVAEVAEVSKPTLFRYFPTKEDLALHRFADHETESGRVVAQATPDDSPLDALHRHFAHGLAQQDPVTGLNDDPEVLGFHRLLYGTPSLVARLHTYQKRSEAALAAALAQRAAGAATTAGAAAGPATAAEDLRARLAAGQIVAVQRILAEENWRRMEQGERVERVYPEAVAAAETGFGQLREGVAAHF